MYVYVPEHRPQEHTDVNVHGYVHVYVHVHAPEHHLNIVFLHVYASERT